MSPSSAHRPAHVLTLISLGLTAAVLAAPAAATPTALDRPAVDRGMAGLTELAELCYVRRGRPDTEVAIRLPSERVPEVLRASWSYLGPCAEYGPPLPLGQGSLRTYTQTRDDRPVALGVTFPASALRGLPTQVSDAKHCFDKNSDGELDLHTECSVGHEHVLDLPAAFEMGVDTPFRWSLTNWNPQGHVPAGVYDVPHFDFHFYIQPLKERNRIDPGPCPVLTDCADYERAKVPVPAQYIHPDFEDLDAVEPAMGNHLIDLTGPEFNGEPFTHTWIYGTYDGEITFYEAMITKEWFDRQRVGENPDRCVPIKLPEAWRLGGWYPTEYCMEYRENRDDYTVALTRFAYRTAS